MSAAWAAGASLYIFFTPTSIHGVSGFMSRDAGAVVETFTRQLSWYEAQGLWGTLWLVLFSALYLLAVRAAWRGNLAAISMLSATAVALSVVTGFSIGGAYLPAALGLVVGTLLFFSSRILRAR